MRLGSQDQDKFSSPVFCSNKISGLMLQNKMNVFAFYSGKHMEDKAVHLIQDTYSGTLESITMIL